MIVQMAASNTLLQTIAQEDKMGRVMSFFAMSFRGMVPFGSLIAGTLAARLGAPLTVAMGAMTALLGVAWFSKQLPKVRSALGSLYQERGFSQPPKR
jgi:MFS-type transporter involved in bile tolerance (Atg22 family)